MSHQEIISSHFKGAKVNLIGQGAFGQVYSVQDHQNKKLAVKVVDNKYEKEGWREFNHPNLLKYFTARHFHLGNYSYLCCEFVGENLRQYRKRFNTIDERAVWELIKQMHSALDKLKTLFLIHRDVKLDNILVRDGPGFQLVLCDFGLAKSELSTCQVSTAGTRAFMAPELQRDRKIGFEQAKKVDIYSLGRTVIHFVLGEEFLKYTNESASSLLRRVENCGIKNRKLLDLIQGMILEDPLKRFSIEEIGMLLELRNYSQSDSTTIQQYVNNSRPTQSNSTTIQQHSSSQSRKKTPIKDVPNRKNCGITKQVSNRRNVPLLLLAGCLIGGTFLALGHASKQHQNKVR
ncbi:predicted protein [Naegleria gruberi]|uniref:Predicted protein n=1 Tax=Naegleria gruberi TaxID=5762 RepID=D2VBY0_NAEGR|nr:uncharacterized protein NAEGRDRAFT_66375 [Naegleria gruberi]EFC45655.1 predicted protein [Naegleria gruberi]|eukprot:XP_002678399.1 predicted protein [Naegleria gruberi strain NEG-M]